MTSPEVSLKPAWNARARSDVYIVGCFSEHLIDSFFMPMQMILCWNENIGKMGVTRGEVTASVK